MTMDNNNMHVEAAIPETPMVAEYGVTANVLADSAQCSQPLCFDARKELTPAVLEGKLLLTCK